MADGWIKIYRSIVDDELYFAEKFTRLQAWLDLLLLAEYMPREFYIRGIPVKLERGQLAVSIRNLASRWKWGVNKVQDFIKELKSCGKIDTQKSNTINVIIICKYDKYQSDEPIKKSETDTQVDTLNVKTDTQADTQTDTPLRNIKEDIDNNIPHHTLTGVVGEELFNKLEIMMKKMEEQAEKIDILQHEIEASKSKKKKEPNPLITKGRKVFEKRYNELFESDYYWKAKDAVAMDSLTKQLIYSRQKKNLEVSEDDVILALEKFLSMIDDEWILKNFSVTNINSKYNELVAQARAKKNKLNGNNSRNNNQSEAEQRMQDAAERAARLLAEDDARSEVR